jgi:Mrp family chromosome partitioning ATPase
VGGTVGVRRSRREGLPRAVALVLAMTVACIAGAAALTLLRGAEYESTATVRGAGSPEPARSAAVARRALDIAGARGEPAAALLDHSDVGPGGAGLAFTVRAEEPAPARRLADGYARGYVESLPEVSRARAMPAGSAERTAALPTALLIGAGIGLVGGLTLAVMREALDVRRTSSRRVAARLGLRELGQVPEAPEEVEEAYRLAALESPGSPTARAYAELGDTVAGEARAAAAQVVAVCGTVGEDHGEHVAAGLGTALAAPGRRVAVVEVDPSHPTLRRLFALARRPGLAEVARGKTTLEEALAPVPGVSGLCVLAAGAGPAPGHESTEPVLDALRERFDLVVVAGPPLLHDGAEGLAGADSLLLAVALRGTRYSRRPRLERLLAGLEMPVLGFVLVASANGASGLSATPA